ncbi:MAG: insulinase family protein [Phycisphaerales bacterium]|nr:insulinase family protein [Phycisphaerales bacterium]
MMKFAYRLMAVAMAALSAAPIVAADRLFDYHETTLDNGLHVITLEDFSCPIVNVQLWYHVGSRDEDPERQGFAHMFEHMMFRGTDRLGPTDHFDLIRATGGSCNAYTAFDQTVYHETLPANQLPLALWLEAERMAFLKIDQDSFDTERKVVEEERRMGLNRPYGRLMEKVLAALHTTHPYHWSPIGNIAHLRAASTPELRAFWTKYYVPNNATLVIAGAVHHDVAELLAEQMFGWIPQYGNPDRATELDPIPTQQQDLILKEDNAPAPLCGMLFRTVPMGHPDEVPLQLLGIILGGGESSRIYRDLVADKQMAAMAMAGSFDLQEDGLFGAAAVLSPMGGDIDAVLKELETQVARLRDEPVTERELEKARNQVLRNLITQNLTIESKASAIGRAAALEGDADAANRQIEEIREVTPADLQRVAQKYLDPQKAFVGRVERNLMGSLASFAGLNKDEEESAPITAQPDTTPPPPGRPGLTRPDSFPTEPPSADIRPTDITPKFEERRLMNDLKIIVVENHEVPFVTVQLGLRGGAWCESKPGAAEMALSMLTRGAGAYSEGDLADELETYAITLNGNAGMDTSSITLTCLTEHLDRGMKLLSTCVREPTFSPEEFNKLRSQTLTGMAIQANSPDYLADRELRRQLYGDHPYARSAPGEIADVEALTINDLQAWWGTFARPDMAALIFAGDIDADKAVELAKEYLGPWQHNYPAPRTEIAAAPAAQPTHIYLVDHPGVQTQIRVGQRSLTRKDDGYFTSRVVSGYFGGAFNSRLNDVIRVQKGLTYGARGGYTAMKRDGRFVVSTFTKNETVGETVQAIFTEIDRLRSEPPTDKELNDTKSYMLGSFPGERETPQAVAGDLWLIESESLPANYFERLLSAVATTTADDCAKLAQTTLDPKQMVVVVCGPAAQIRDQLETIAPVTVITGDSEPAHQ